MILKLIVALFSNQINKALNYLFDPGEKAALLAVPKVIKKGIVVDDHLKHKARSVDSITFTAPVEINDVRGNVGVVVQRLRGTNRFKTLRILLPNGKAFEFAESKFIYFSLFSIYFITFKIKCKYKLFNNQLHLISIL